MKSRRCSPRHARQLRRGSLEAARQPNHALGAKSAKTGAPACEWAAAEKRMTDIGEVTSGGSNDDEGGGSESGSWLGGTESIRKTAEWFSRLDKEEADPQPGLVVFVCVFTLASLALMLYAVSSQQNTTDLGRQSRQQKAIFHEWRALNSCVSRGAWSGSSGSARAESCTR
jgi:hypothetical protein